MIFRMRKDVRQSISRRAWISVGNDLALRQCTLIDISDSGAKLELEDPDKMPDKFSLLLSHHGHPRYSCQIVWSDQSIIGVRFSSD
jgi:hypothetical protein